MMIGHEGDFNKKNIKWRQNSQIHPKLPFPNIIKSYDILIQLKKLFPSFESATIESISAIVMAWMKNHVNITTFFFPHTIIHPFIYIHYD